ncbi:sulfotransferase family 2 domain-containing protein [Nocardioides pantholopis]|uniref:sulfotransferase family 2 domain-containing protein n=1 Tax=Nocardioides pantholopis TaxID=2483798 RepID=UPI000F07DCEA|nr:sulfotransferase family 2 domain-containing protein [Nocardioides pantholopis]
MLHDETERAVLFVHVPKTGGSTMERLFTASGWRMVGRETNRTHPRIFPLRRVSPQHQHAALLRELFRLDRFELAFLISRDPIARFRSEWAMRHTSVTDPTPEQVEEWADRFFARYAEDPYVLDNHLRPQHEFLTPGAAVFRLEDGMDAIVADLNERHRLGLRTEVPHALDSSKRGISSSAVPVSAALEDRLREFYAEDFRTFGYA